MLPNLVCTVCREREPLARELDPERFICDACAQELVARVAELEAENQRLRGALIPFAKAADDFQHDSLEGAVSVKARREYSRQRCRHLCTTWELAEAKRALAQEGGRDG